MPSHATSVVVGLARWSAVTISAVCAREARNRTAARLLCSDDLLSTLPENGPAPLKVGLGRGAQWLKAQLGAYAGRIKPEDWQRDDRFGHLRRKHVKP